MYRQVWNKYLPIIRILVKRALTSDQSLSMNATDFERASAGRKAGYKFSMSFNNGRLDSPVSTSPVAKDLLDTLLQDPVIKELFIQHKYVVEMSPKFLLVIKAVPDAQLETDVAMHSQPVTETVE